MTGTPGGSVLAGREKDRALLDAAITRLAAGEGGCVLVQGDPGIGKSALVDAVLADARRLEVDVLRGECDELDRRLLPLSPMLTVLGVDPDSADPRRASAARALTGSAGCGRGGRAALVHGVNATAASIETLSALVDHMCAARPVVMAVDDLHSADEASLRLWLRLSRAAAQLPLLLIGAYRPSARRAELEHLREQIACSPHGTLIRLDPLSADEARRLAADLVGAAPGARFAELVQLAAGNPLYVREIVAAVVRCGSLSVTEGIAELTDEPGSGLRGRGALPVSAVIADHVDFLSARCREVLRVAAVQGLDFRVPDVARLAGIPAEEVSSLADEASRAGIVEGGGGRFRFRHGLIRQALFDEVPPPVRSAMHKDAALHLIRSAAATLPTAEAVLRALDVADGWERDWLAANARELAYRGPQAAADLFEHAIAHGDAGERAVAEFEDLLVMVCANLARYEQVERITRHVLTSSADPERLGHACLQLARVLGFQAGRIDEAIAVAAHGMNDPRIPPLWRVRLHARYAVFLQILGRDGADRVAEAVLAEARRLGDRAAQSVALHVLALHAGRYGHMARSMQLFDQALAFTHGDAELVDTRLTAFLNKAAFCDTLGLREQCQEALRIGRAEAEQVGSPRLACFRVMAGTIAGNYGRWDDALAEYGQLDDETIYADLTNIVHARCAMIAVRRDEHAAVKRHLAALEHCRSTHDTPPTTFVFIVGARALAAQRDGRLREAVEILRPVAEDPAFQILERGDWLPLTIRLALHAGDRELARCAAEAARLDAEREPIRFKLQTHAWCRGLFAGDPASLQAAVTMIRQDDKRADLAFALEDMAVVHAARGEVGSAKVAMHEALSLYAGLGAGWDTRRAAARLRPFGVRPGVRGSRQRPRTGWQSLSETQRDVAVLAAQGMSNPDIAARLLLSRRTVQTHVSHVLAKLGAHSRREIARHVPQA